MKIIFYNNIVADSQLSGHTNIGGLVGDIDAELFEAPNMKFYYNNYIHANLTSEDEEKVSMGVGANKANNNRIQNTNIYKYSKINNVYASEFTDTFKKEQYISSDELKVEDTYKNKFGFKNIFEYTSLKNNKYPLIPELKGQDGISLPEDADYIENTINITSQDKLEHIGKEKQQYTFKYDGKIIKTYETYSEIIAEDGSKVIREDMRLYVKDGKLYALPVMMDLGDYEIKLDSYNGKEYETVLGLDGKLYDLKETLNYPENFVNSNIERIGNNLDLEDFAESLSVNDKNETSIGKFSQKESKNEHEVEVVYKSGDKLKFNYQTGEIVSSSKSKEQKESTADSKFEASKDLLEYVKEQFSKIGNYTNTDKINIEMQNKYEEMIKLENKLEEISVEEAIKKYKVKNSGESDFDEEKSKNEDNNINANIGEAEKTEDNNETNNSLKEKKYISIYNAEKDDYQIYQEEELLDTSKQEVISENEKIEANNLNEYYASDGKATNMNMGIVWIALSIIGVIIILFVIKKRD